MVELACKTGVRPRSLWIAAALSRLTVPVSRLTITAGRNGKHVIGSKHGTDEALDVRTKNFSSLAAKRACVQQLQAALGPEYDVILESVGTGNEHIHVEYDP